MKETIILALVASIVLIILGVETSQNRKTGIKVTPGELLRRHIIFWSMLTMVGSLIGTLLCVWYFIFNISFKYFWKICICLTLLIISKFLYSKNKL